MELSQLIYFRTTAQEEHFTRAAELLHITQPSLSKAIANLEEELGAPLFDREGKRVRLNACGQAFLEKVEQILSLTEEACFMIRDMRQGERGQGRIGPFPSRRPRRSTITSMNFPWGIPMWRCPSTSIPRPRLRRCWTTGS